MSVRLIVVLSLLNISCTAVFNSNDANLSLALSKYNDFAYFVEMEDPISVSSQGKLSKSSLDFTYSCYYDQILDDSVSTTTSCNDLDNFFFNSTSGDFSWSPDSTQSGDYEFKVLISTEIKGKTETKEKVFKASAKF